MRTVYLDGHYYKADVHSGCWQWTGYLNRHGYGRFGDGGILAHRAVYAAFCGDIPDGMHVCHHCDNPSCVRPGHLFLGTQNDNVQDMIAKGRMDTTWPTRNAHRMLRGSDQPRAKLTEQEVRDIRDVYEMSGRARGIQSAMAKIYEVSPQTINGILKGREWQHV